jgi:hypothetical protein
MVVTPSFDPAERALAQHEEQNKSQSEIECGQPESEPEIAPNVCVEPAHVAERHRWAGVVVLRRHVGGSAAADSPQLRRI